MMADPSPPCHVTAEVRVTPHHADIFRPPHLALVKPRPHPFPPGDHERKTRNLLGLASSHSLQTGLPDFDLARAVSGPHGSLCAASLRQEIATTGRFPAYATTEAVIRLNPGENQGGNPSFEPPLSLQNHGIYLLPWAASSILLILAILTCFPFPGNRLRNSLARLESFEVNP
jgi:hypothetical protein